MKKLLVLLFALFACDAKVSIGTESRAQGQLAGGGLRTVQVLDGGLCSGLGTRNVPINCTVAVDTDGGVSGTGSAGDPISVGDDFGLLIFGDGSDGDAVISSNTNLSRDVFYNNLTVNDGFALGSIGYRIHVKGTLTLNGVIHANGGNGTNGTAGSSTVAACASANGANACCSGWYPDSVNGGTGNLTGGVGGTESASLFATVGAAGGAGGSTGLGNDGTDNTAVPGRGGGGASGGGFVGTASGVGGNGGGATQFATDNFGGPTDINDFLMVVLTNRKVNNTTQWSGSGGGGGGGSCGKETVNTTQREPGGGGGGASAGTLVVIARRIVVGPNGLLAAHGGNGGNGGSCGTHTGDAGGGGGAGGGAGGHIFFMIGSGPMPDDIYFDVTGGSGGTPGVACVGGQNGGQGGAGGTGTFYKYRADGLQ